MSWYPNGKHGHDNHGARLDSGSATRSTTGPFMSYAMRSYSASRAATEPKSPSASSSEECRLRRRAARRETTQPRTEPYIMNPEWSEDEIGIFTGNETPTLSPARLSTSTTTVSGDLFEARRRLEYAQSAHPSSSASGTMSSADETDIPNLVPWDVLLSDLEPYRQKMNDDLQGLFDPANDEGEARHSKLEWEGEIGDQDQDEEGANHNHPTVSLSDSGPLTANPTEVGTGSESNGSLRARGKGALATLKKRLQSGGRSTTYLEPRVLEQEGNESECSRSIGTCDLDLGHLSADSTASQQAYSAGREEMSVCPGLCGFGSVQSADAEAHEDASGGSIALTESVVGQDDTDDPAVSMQAITRVGEFTADNPQSRLSGFQLYAHLLLGRPASQSLNTIRLLPEQEEGLTKSTTYLKSVILSERQARIIERQDKLWELRRRRYGKEPDAWDFGDSGEEFDMTSAVKQTIQSQQRNRNVALETLAHSAKRKWLKDDTLVSEGGESQADYLERIRQQSDQQVKEYFNRILEWYLSASEEDRTKVESAFREAWGQDHVEDTLRKQLRRATSQGSAF